MAPIIILILNYYSWILLVIAVHICGIDEWFEVEPDQVREEEVARWSQEYEFQKWLVVLEIPEQEERYQLRYVKF